MAPRKRKYLVTLQIGTGGESPADRQPLYGRENESTVVEAISLENAVRKARNRAANPRETRIVAAEEIHGKPFISDEQIYTALFEEADDCVRLDPDAYDPGLSTYIDLDFNSVVKDVEAALQNTIAPGLTISLIDDIDGSADYSMIEQHDRANWRYRAVGSEIKHLIHDRTATGTNGPVSIARALLETSSQLL